MPRGMVPRQPARGGRQDKVHVARTLLSAKSGQKQSIAVKDARARTSASTAAKPRERRRRVTVMRPESLPAPAPESGLQSRCTRTRGGNFAAARPDVSGRHCALTHASAWELLVATILSAQSTDANVNRVTPELFRKYPAVAAAFAALTPEQLEPDVRSTGFFRNKSKSVVGAAKKIVAEFGGEVPKEMEKLLTLPGVARKTANVVAGDMVQNL